MADRLGKRDALAVLEDTLNRCSDEDMRSAQVFAALDYLEGKTPRNWPFEQFRRALNIERAEDRWQTANAAMNGSRPALSLNRR